MSVTPSPLFVLGRQSRIFCRFFVEPRNYFWPIPLGSCGWGGMSACAVYAGFQSFLDVNVFHNSSEWEGPTLRGSIQDFVIVWACYNTKGFVRSP